MIIAVIWMSAAITKRFSDKSYFVLNTTALLFATADAAWGLVHNKSVPCAPWGMMVILDLYYLTMVLAVISLAQYVARNMRPESLKVFRWVLFWVYAATIVLVAADHWTGIIYTVTAQGEYIRGKANMLPSTIAFVLYVLLFAAMLRGSSRGRKRSLYFVTYALPVCVMSLQYVFPELPFYSMAFSLILIGMALTKEYRQRELLVDALNAAERANRAKTTFLNNMSHDIRTSMNAIIGFTALAAAHVDEPELVQDYLAKISTSGQHLLSLINDVLDMSRIESGRVKIGEKEVHLPDVMHDLRTIVNANIVSKNIEFFIDAVDVDNEDILCDKLRLNQVLLNLLSNAVKYTKNGGQIIVRIIQKPGFSNGYATYEFHVKDNGIGMSKEFQKHLFEAFTREESATVSGIQGTGLGMAISKNIVDMMGGTISVESEEGKGTEYTVSIPFKVLGNSAKYEVVPQLQGVRVLVADDDSNTAISVSRMVQKIGMRSEWTLSGKEAVLRTKVAVEQGDEFGAYIIDWMMPDLNGIETVRRIRKLIGESKPIIILTAYDWADIEQEAREAGVTAFCSKPLFMSELRDVLSQPYRVKKEETPASPYRFEGKKVLLVEDNLLNREIAQAILQDAGFTVDTADDGDVAVERLQDLKQGEFDLVLMDIQMPKMDGYAATRQIRTLPSDVANVPIVAMTANAFEEDKQKTVRAGMNAHIAKPIEAGRLMETLSHILT